MELDAEQSSFVLREFGGQSVNFSPETLLLKLALSGVHRFSFES